MKPRLLLIDEPCKKAKEMLAEVFDFVEPDKSEFTTDFTAVFTGLTPVVTNATVFCPCTGIDHIMANSVIYLDKSWKRVEGRNVTSTAEHTWSLILQMAKMKKMQLSGKSIGIIGYGRIGQQVKKYAESFGMYVFVNDITDYKKVWDSKDYIFEHCDIITLHVPLNDETKGMISLKELEIMKDGALLINTSRPEIINKSDLKISILNKNIYYADDFKDSFDLFNYHANVIQTRHIAGNCIEAREATDIYIANKAIEWWKERNK